MGVKRYLTRCRTSRTGSAKLKMMFTLVGVLAILLRGEMQQCQGKSAGARGIVYNVHCTLTGRGQGTLVSKCLLLITCWTKYNSRLLPIATRTAFLLTTCKGRCIDLKNPKYPSSKFQGAKPFWMVHRDSIAVAARKCFKVETTKTWPPKFAPV